MEPSPHRLSAREYKKTLREIGSLNRTGMQDANDGNFPSAFSRILTALSMARELDKKCIEAKVLNSLGILHAMEKRWDQALLTYDQAMDIVAEHYGTNNVLYQTLGKNMLYLFH
ncbi:MAG: tetratricopeptide repeat protein [Desulfobacterales bacterium]|nr:tetratricopeptide repeat protein [Desulfobacterales bacterium]